jgi:class 3 adenylate cyclase
MIQTKNLTIMFTDMKGFTARTSTHSREQLHHLLELQDNLIKPAINQFDGNIVKTIGDAFLVTFESPTDAVLCGMKIQENILNHNARATSSDQIDVRIAINLGEVNIKDNDIFGEPVNIASRIESIAEPNEIYFTEAVYLAMNKNEIPTAEIGYRRLKGVPEQIKIYKVLSEQTNLIRAKLKREQLAQANANLAKDQENPVVKAEPILPEIKTIEQKQILPKKSFWQRHKKKIIIVLIILFILILAGNANKNKQTKLYPSEINQIKTQLASYKLDFAKATENNDQKKINEILNYIQKVANNDPPLLIKQWIISFAQNQLKNPALNSDQREILNKIIKELK